jgi:hypothetical protein
VLKDAIVKLKDEGKVLLRIAELKQQLDMRLPGEQFSLDELRAVVGLLAGPGVVWQLDFGDFVLLQPERINHAELRQVRQKSWPYETLISTSGMETKPYSNEPPGELYEHTGGRARKSAYTESSNQPRSTR